MVSRVVLPTPRCPNRPIRCGRHSRSASAVEAVFDMGKVPLRAIRAGNPSVLYPREERTRAFLGLAGRFRRFRVGTGPAAVDEAEGGEGDGAEGGAVLEEEVSRLDGSALGLQHAGPQPRPQPQPLLDR